MSAVTNIIQPSSIFKMLNVKNNDDAEKVMSTTLSFLLYMKPGDILKTSNINFEKISPDLIYLDTDLNKDQMLDELSKKKIIKLPI